MFFFCTKQVNLLVSLHFFLAALPSAILTLNFSPYQRDIFCNDQTIKYPYKKDTISHGTMAAVTITCSIVIVRPAHLSVQIPVVSRWNYSCRVFFPQITTGEAFLVYKKRLHSNTKFNQYLSTLYKVVGTYLFGAAVSQSLTDLAKFTIGRPRPNFFSVCAPVSCEGLVLRSNCTGAARNVTESRWAARLFRNLVYKEKTLKILFYIFVIVSAVSKRKLLKKSVCAFYKRKLQITLEMITELLWMFTVSVRKKIIGFIFLYLLWSKIGNVNFNNDS